MVDQSQLIAIIAKAIRDVRVDYPAIEPGLAHESVPFAKAVPDALDKANLEIVPKGERRRERPADVIRATMN